MVDKEQAKQKLANDILDLVSTRYVLTSGGYKREGHDTLYDATDMESAAVELIDAFLIRIDR